MSRWERLTALYARKMQDAALGNAQVHAVGGSAWSATRTTGGNGIDQAATETTHTIEPASVFQIKRRVPQPDGAGFVEVAEWQICVIEAADIEVGDLLRSEADVSLQFQVMSLERPAGYISGVVEEVV